MSQGEGIRQKLAAGREELGKAVAPREAGFANAETMLGQVNEMQTTLGGMLAFFAALKERITPELGEPFDEMRGHYRAACNHILPVLEGVSDDNQPAFVAKGNISQAKRSGDNIVDTLTQGLGYDPLSIDVNFIEQTLVGLQKAELCMKEVAEDLHHINAVGPFVRRCHEVGDRATQQYADEL